FFWIERNSNREALSDRILAGPHPLSHLAINHAHGQGSLLIDFSKLSPFEHRDTHSSEVSWRHNAVAGQRRLMEGREGMALGPKDESGAGICGRRAPGRDGRLHAREHAG